MDILLQLNKLWNSTGIANFAWQQVVMIFISLVLIYLAVKKNFEPLLLVPIGFGGILANVPLVDMAHVYTYSLEAVNSAVGNDVTLTYADKFLGLIFSFGVGNGLFPLLIFMGVGAMTDFGPLIADPKTAILGAAAQVGIFVTLIGSLALNLLGLPFLEGFSMLEAAAIAIIGGADGPTAIYTATRLAEDLLGPIAVAAYSYMALVPIIQPPIMKLLTSKQEREIKMQQLRHVSRTEKILFPLVVLGLCVMLLPDATPLIGALMFGNLVRESGVVDRLSNTLQNSMVNIVTILLGLGVGSKLAADKFLEPKTVLILLLGLVAFSVGTASGVFIAKLMNLFSKKKVNPLIGAAGVSAVPMAARVVNKVGMEANHGNYLLMHAMGPNVAGVIGSAVAAGVLISFLG